MKTDFDVGLRHLRDPGAFAYGVLFVVEERDECPLFGLQLTDGTGQSVEVFLPSLPGIHPLGFAVGQVRQPRLVDAGPFAFAAPCLGDRRVVSDPEEPGRERTAPVEPVQVAERLEENVLSQLLGILCAADDAGNQRVDHPPVPPGKDGIQIGFSVYDPSDQLQFLLLLHCYPVRRTWPEKVTRRCCFPENCNLFRGAASNKAKIAKNESLISNT